VKTAEKIRNFSISDAFKRLMRWVLDRTGLTATYQHQMLVAVPKHARNPIYCLGGITFSAFLIQVVTGLFLMMYYVPSVDHAWDSIKYIESGVPFGYIVRNIHRWSANIMIITVVLHMLRVYFTGSFRKPRELTWMVGVVLLIMTIAAAFTGYVLPWDQRSFWAATVGTNLLTAVEGLPLLGPIAGPAARWLREVFIGGDEIGPATLTHFYGFHVTLLPLLMFAGMLIHFYLIRKHGISGPM